MTDTRTNRSDPLHKKALVIVMSYHHHNTEKLARAIAEVLGAPFKTPHQVSAEELGEHDLIGFGSGIYSDRHHQSLLDCAERIPSVNGKKAFLFSTSGIPAFVTGDRTIERYCIKSHGPLREILAARGFTIVGEFGCPGYNTNSFLRYFGGFNKGRPNAADLHRAAEFAKNIRGQS